MALIPLRVHSEYSFGEGLAAPEALVTAAVERDLPALADRVTTTNFSATALLPRGVMVTQEILILSFKVRVLAR